MNPHKPTLRLIFDCLEKTAEAIRRDSHEEAIGYLEAVASHLNAHVSGTIPFHVVDWLGGNSKERALVIRFHSDGRWPWEVEAITPVSSGDVRSARGLNLRHAILRATAEVCGLSTLDGSPGLPPELPGELSRTELRGTIR